MQDFRKLLVWQKAHELALLTYRLTADFPRDEVFGLRNSLRRTSVDVPAFIAEGCGKSSDAEFSKCIGGALALVTRLEYYALIALDLGMFSEANYKLLVDLIVETRKMLSGFTRRLAAPDG